VRFPILVQVLQFIPQYLIKKAVNACKNHPFYGIQLEKPEAGMV
jgi:hypothetical protein